jgi:leader peptidase (prepilin peptidase)/N-methyltransferase
MGSIDITLLITSALIVCLAYLSYIDLRSLRLPDSITLPLIATGIGFNALSELRFTSLQSALLGASLGYLFIWSLNAAYRFFKGQHGIGMGDAKLLAGLGAWLGWHALPSILLLASISGLVGGIAWLKLNKQGRQHAFPFGPFLAFAGIIELLWPQILYSTLAITPI